MHCKVFLELSKIYKAKLSNFAKETVFKKNSLLQCKTTTNLMAVLYVCGSTWTLQFCAVISKQILYHLGCFSIYQKQIPLNTKQITLSEWNSVSLHTLPSCLEVWEDKTKSHGMRSREENEKVFKKKKKKRFHYKMKRSAYMTWFDSINLSFLNTALIWLLKGPYPFIFSGQNFAPVEVSRQMYIGGMDLAFWPWNSWAGWVHSNTLNGKKD